MHINPREITVTTPNETIIKYFCHNEQNFDYICQQVCKEAQLNPVNMRLYKNNKILELNRHLCELEISNMDKFEIQDTERILIHVKAISEKVNGLQMMKVSSIEDLKREIQSVKGIPTDLQNLFHNGEQLDGKDIFQKYNIIDGSNIELFPQLRPNPTGMQIFVKMHTRKTLLLNVKLDDTIERMKKQIHRKETVSDDQQMLVFCRETI
ncbi:MAG: hypothetical protein EZS28_013872 [Streblomastix strix]|uniref:Ubiquitin-like domain-containing protein n=1 Tax=Streblomastix strix TaxID=222440 RepID=A0A5J4W7H7_9EUKA|nr:MAG: hypothetical protein EZS28_013872 [Streblomastix strix]